MPDRCVNTFTIISLGCRSNYADSQGLKQKLTGQGYHYLPFTPGVRADLYLINTCTVTSRADFDSRSWVRKARHWNPAAQVIATGCYAQIQSARLLHEGADLVLGNLERERIGEILRPPKRTQNDTADSTDGRFLRHPERGEGSQHPGPLTLGAKVRRKGVPFSSLPADDQDRTRPVLKIQDGCDQCCSFCIIPTTRGRSRSLSPDALLQQYRGLVEKGAREVVLSGINLSSYGKDLSPHTNFAEVLKLLEGEPDSTWIRISSIESGGLTADLLALLRTSRKICPHFHVPLQSGDPEILARMNRPHSYEEYAEKIRALAEVRSDMCIGSDVMVGFPGESDRQFENTLRAVGSLPFAYVHVFPYSVRPGTKAAKMDGRLDRKVRQRRSTELCRLGAMKRTEFLARQLGFTHEALVETDVGDNAGEWRATTRNYVRMAFSGSAVTRNQIVSLRAVAIEGARLRGALENAEPRH